MEGCVLILGNCGKEFHALRKMKFLNQWAFRMSFQIHKQFARVRRRWRRFEILFVGDATFVQGTFSVGIRIIDREKHGETNLIRTN